MAKTGGDILIETIQDWGVEVVFGLPGGAAVHDAIGHCRHPGAQTQIDADCGGQGGESEAIGAFRGVFGHGVGLSRRSVGKLIDVVAGPAHHYIIAFATHQRVIPAVAGEHLSTIANPHAPSGDDAMANTVFNISSSTVTINGTTVTDDLFAAHVESERLPGDVYSAIILGGRQLFRAQHTSGSSQFIEIYSPITLEPGQNYILALPFIVQARQIQAQVNDLATSIYMLLVFIVLAAIAVAYRAARTVTGPVQALVGGARAVAGGADARAAGVGGAVSAHEGDSDDFVSPGVPRGHPA